MIYPIIKFKKRLRNGYRTVSKERERPNAVHIQQQIPLVLDYNSFNGLFSKSRILLIHASYMGEAQDGTLKDVCTICSCCYRPERAQAATSSLTLVVLPSKA